MKLQRSCCSVGVWVCVWVSPALHDCRRVSLISLISLSLSHFSLFLCVSRSFGLSPSSLSLWSQILSHFHRLAAISHAPTLLEEAEEAKLRHIMCADPDLAQSVRKLSVETGFYQHLKDVLLGNVSKPIPVDSSVFPTSPEDPHRNPGAESLASPPQTPPLVAPVVSAPPPSRSRLPLHDSDEVASADIVVISQKLSEQQPKAEPQDQKQEDPKEHNPKAEPQNQKQYESQSTAESPDQETEEDEEEEQEWQEKPKKKPQQKQNQKLEKRTPMPETKIGLTKFTRLRTLKGSLHHIRSAEAPEVGDRTTPPLTRQAKKSQQEAQVVVPAQRPTISQPQQSKIPRARRRKYCVCARPDEEGELWIGCDSPEPSKCPGRGWYHLKCTPLAALPNGEWICHSCSQPE